VIAVWIVIAVVVLGALWAVGSYNGLVRQRNQIKDAWANIDAELRRRYDLIPNLVETVKGYASHERETFEAVTNARSAAMAAGPSPGAQAAAEGPFVSALRSLFAVAENYPELKANQNFLQLQQELSTTEDRIAGRRQSYNTMVQNFNAHVQSFPAKIIAGMFGFKEEEFFRVDDAIRDAGAPRVSFAQGAADQAASPGGADRPESGGTPPAPPAPGG
jgi:LemA protein